MPRYISVHSLFKMVSLRSGCRKAGVPPAALGGAVPPFGCPVVPCGALIISATIIMASIVMITHKMMFTMALIWLALAAVKYRHGNARLVAEVCRHLRNLTDDLHALHDLPEDGLVDVIEFAVTGADEAAVVAWFRTKETSSSSSSSSEDDKLSEYERGVERLLHIVMAVERNDVFLTESLRRLSELPPETRVYSGHEYTQTNARFALTVEPDNPALQERARRIDADREAGRPTVPSLLSEELETNPFLRAHLDSLKSALGMAGAGDAETFAEIRSRKDRF